MKIAYEQLNLVRSFFGGEEMRGIKDLSTIFDKKLTVPF